MSALVTDGALSMVGKNDGLVVIKKYNKNLPLRHNHCIVHQQNPCAKSTNIDEVLKFILKAVNFIKSRGLNHRDFQIFLRETNAEYGDVAYLSDVRWLTRGKCLNAYLTLIMKSQLLWKVKENLFRNSVIQTGNETSGFSL